MKGQRITISFRRLALAISILAISFIGASAQSTVFNIPSSDVQSPGKVYLEADFMIHFGSLREGGYQEYGSRLVVGLPGNMEVGINGFHTHAESPEPIELQPNFKWQFYSKEKHGLAFAAGVHRCCRAHALVFSRPPCTTGQLGLTRACVKAGAASTAK